MTRLLCALVPVMLVTYKAIATPTLEYIEHKKLSSNVSPISSTTFPHLRATFTYLNSTPSVCYTTGEQVVELNTLSAQPVFYSRSGSEPQACEMLQGETPENSGIYICYSSNSGSGNKFITNRNTLRYTFTGQVKDYLTVNAEGIPVVGTEFDGIGVYLGNPSEGNMFRVGTFDFTVGLGERPKIQFDSEQVLWTINNTPGSGIDFKFERHDASPTTLSASWRQGLPLSKTSAVSTEITSFDFAVVPYRNTNTGLRQFALVDIHSPEGGSHQGHQSPILLTNDTPASSVSDLLRVGSIRDYSVARRHSDSEPDQLFIFSLVSSDNATANISSGYYLSRWRINLEGSNGNGSGNFTETYAADDTPINIPDADVITSTSTIRSFNGTRSIQDLNITLGIEHTWVSDLEVILESPSGTRVELFNDVGSGGDNFTGTLDDEASVAIGSGSAPFDGTYRPHQPLSGFDGETSIGTWKLEVTDDANGDAGLLENWVLEITGADIPDDSYEENDTRQTAWHPGFDWRNRRLSTIGGLAILNDTEWYRIDVNDASSRRVTVSSDFTSTEYTDISIFLFDGGGTRLAFSENTGSPGVLEHVVPATGTYYISYWTPTGASYDLIWNALPMDPGPDPDPDCFSLTINGGSSSTQQNCSGGYTSGTVVTIVANAPSAGKVFDRWTGAVVANPNSVITTINMIGNNTVTANYRNAVVVPPDREEDFGCCSGGKDFKSISDVVKFYLGDISIFVAMSLALVALSRLRLFSTG